MKIEIEIDSCKQCPFVKLEQMLSCDGRPDGWRNTCRFGTWIGKTPNKIHDSCKFKNE